MEQTISIVVSPETLEVAYSANACSCSLPNIICVDNVEKRVVFLGTSRHEVLTQKFMYLREYGKTIDQFSFLPAFQPTTHELEALDIPALSYCLGWLHKHCFSELTKLFALFDFDLVIPGFEDWSQERKCQTIYYLQRRGRARKISINELSVEIPLWKRMLVLFFKILLVDAIPLGGILLIAFLPRNVFSLLGILIFYFLLLILGLLVWGFSLKSLVPESYLANISIPYLPYGYIKNIARRIFHIREVTDRSV